MKPLNEIVMDEMSQARALIHATCSALRPVGSETRFNIYRINTAELVHFWIIYSLSTTCIALLYAQALLNTWISNYMY